MIAAPGLFLAIGCLMLCATAAKMQLADKTEPWWLVCFISLIPLLIYALQ